MTTEEQTRVLRMVSEGKVTAEEAAALLEALEPIPRSDSRGPVSIPAAPQPPPRRLVILVAEGGETKVNVRVPLGLAKAATRFIPRQADERLHKYGVDLKSMLLDLGSSVPDGPLIEVRDGEDHVRIAVE